MQTSYHMPLMTKHTAVNKKQRHQYIYILLDSLPLSPVFPPLFLMVSLLLVL